MQPARTHSGVDTLSAGKTKLNLIPYRQLSLANAAKYHGHPIQSLSGLQRQMLESNPGLYHRVHGERKRPCTLRDLQ